MKRLDIEFKNCHGIRELDASFKFYRNGNSVAIYAPNGTMKTSFARALADLSRGIETQDRMFPERETVRRITDQDGNELTAGDVVVVLSYDEELGPNESTSTLLINPELRKEYEALQLELVEARDELVVALKEQSATKQDVADVVSRVFTQQEDNFFTALVRLNYEIEEQDSAPFAKLPYEVLFNSKVQPILRTPDLQLALADYVTRLNELLDKSTFFSRDSFNFYNAANVTKSLGDNGFFSAQHSILLHGEVGDPKEVTSKSDLDSVIAVEKQRITDDDALRKKLDTVEKALNKNVDTRAFFAYIAKHVELLPEFTNVDLFEQNIWKSYIKTHERLYKRVVDCFKSTEKRKKEIEQQATAESTQWERVIDIFNDRFFVPFRLIANNRDRVVLGQEKLLKLGFEFEEGTESTPVERGDLLQILSNGEKKALYILNVLFEVEARKSSGRETLFVIDDLADSFDYKNKYAIIQYLKEMSEQSNFRLILLTHNFDFFRTLESRAVVGYDRCFMAQKSESKIVLSNAVGVKNPFIKDFKLKFFENGMKRVACIPFIRNILEYTKGESDPDYLKLTSLLHWKSDTSSITHHELDSIFTGAFGGDGVWPSSSDAVLDLVIEQANLALKADEGANFENKIVMSIAIRLLSERHMVAELADREFTDNIPANQTQALFKAYKNRRHGSAEARETLDAVVLMTPENIHVNSFMYEPIMDMSDAHLRRLYNDIQKLHPTS
ncbi:phage infection protein [Amycolatopsis palatopharyngis]|uniref:phage infection protein n=1 Tax=Amycolatopsis palatopharyngis TaxID=187982 RepID=UPI000E22FBD9|nr:phage infection protein [Amycolatopsis palatopharyngis]